MNINREKLAWAAGLYDGEGSTYIGLSHGRSKIHMCVAQKDRRVLDRFKEAVGNLGKVHGPYDHGMHYWRAASFESCQATIGLIGTFLGPVKREQIEKVLQNVTFNPPKDNTKCGQGHIYETTGRRTDGKCAECAREYDRKRYENGRIINGVLWKKGVSRA